MTMTRTSGNVAAVIATPAMALQAYVPSVPGVYGRPDLQMALLGKRLLDIVLSALLLIVSLPLLAGAAMAIRLTSRGPVIFGQRRIGLRGVEFTMYKLRTMCADAEQAEETMAAEQPGRIFFKQPADPRVTAVGRWLRKYSIDEIPQFLNVLRGDMSLVGPRPLLACDWQHFPRDHHRRRVWMRPGITGLWQVAGRSLCGDQERMRLDVEYVDHWTLTLDLKILLRTPAAVLSAQGAW
jgi:lipopolysaccharide/colanic/teichoic acid biosynthesis glycosyltransferase